MLILIEHEKKIIDIDPAIVSNLIIEFCSTFVDINHYSRHDWLMKSAKRLADAFPEIQDYQIAYVIASLKV